MQSHDDSHVTLREVIEKTLKPGKRLQALLAHPLMELPLEKALLRRDSFLQDVRHLPHIGAGTVTAIAEALDRAVASAYGDQTVRVGRPVPSAHAKAAGAPRTQTHARPIQQAQRSQDDALDLTRSDIHPFWLWVQSGGVSAYYLPFTLPNILMTPAVWHVENRKHDLVLGYVPSMEDVVETLMRTDKQIEFVIDHDVWMDFTTATGPFALLAKHEIKEQVSVFHRLQRLTFGRVSFSTASHKENGLSKCLVSEGGFLSTYLFGGHYISHSEHHINQTMKAIQAANPRRISQLRVDTATPSGQVIRFSRARQHR